MKETGKGRRSRIELGYYRVPDRLSRLRGRLCLLAILATGGWLAATAIAGRNAAPHSWSIEPRRLVSKGPLAKVHAMWDSTCEACHVSFAPINGSRWAPSPWAGSQAGSQNCRACHAGPAHHDSEPKNEVPACAECHRDHRGREASLLALGDVSCTNCHQDLAAHRNPSAGPLSVARAVTRFDLEHHPEITASWTKRAADPRRIKFNHALHVSAGLTLEKGGAAFSFGQLSVVDRARYGWKDQEPLNTPIQLECASCHQPEAEEKAPTSDHLARSAAAPRPSGAYMLPIVYENHCAACHPLYFDTRLPDVSARHGIAPQELLKELKQLYMSDAASADQSLLGQFVPARPMPGQTESPAKQSIRQAVDDKVLAAAKLLFGAALDERVRRREKLPAGRRGCVECHNLRPTSGPIVGASSLTTLEIEPVLLTPVWQKSAAFDHRAHRALACTECHAGARTSIENGDQPLLPGISRCVSCHAPEGSSQPLRASAACTECHRYHNGDHAEQGLSARARRSVIQQTLEQFLKGGLPADRK